MLPTEQKITGTIERIHFSSATWSAGKLCAELDKRVTLIGNFEKDPTYGLQFKVKSMCIDMPINEEGLAVFLEKHPQLKRIGKIRSKKLVQEFGKDFEKILLERPDEIAHVAKIPLESVKQIAKEWQLTATTNTAMIQLAAFGLSYHQMSVLTAKYDNNVIAILKQDPYLMLGEIDGFGFKRIDEIALKSGVKKELPGRIKACLKWIVKDALNNEGSTWIKMDKLINTANDYLHIDDLRSINMIGAALNKLVMNEKLRSDIIDREGIIALPIMYEAEKKLAETFKKYGQLFSRSNKENIPLKSFIGNADDIREKLNEDQRLAFGRVLYKMSLISGGAGTGKSYTVAAITEFFSGNNYNITLCAPTGKAARRLEEVCDNKHQAFTIHKLLGYNGREFHINADNQLDTDIVIVDEVSMVDVPLMHALFEAINFDKTSIILVGDHNQLPPIGPGNILRDLVQTQAIPTTILTECIRQQGDLKKNCSAILSGEMRSTTPVLENGCREWYVINNLTAPGMVSALLKEMFEKHLLKLKFDILKDVQVLTPTHKGIIGTVELNKMLQKIIQKQIYKRNVSETHGKRARPMKGDKVICTKNNYSLEIMNGEIGVVLSIDHRGCRIDFGNSKQRTLEKEDMKYIQVAYALTIHKVQGSEFPCAVLIMHKSHSWMHHRGLLYTGVTRAQKTAIILGDSWGIKNCLNKVKIDNRNTFLGGMLK